MASNEPSDQRKTGDAAAVRSTGIRHWQLAELLGDAREAVIEHAGEHYRLRLTANKKLILTK